MFLAYKPVDLTVAEAADGDYDLAREKRITAWRGSLCGAVGVAGDPRENNAAEPASLTPLGERLLGLQSW